MSRVLMISTDVVSSTMAGPGIRAWEIARALAAEHTVTLAVPRGGDLVSRGFTLAEYATDVQDPVMDQLLADTDVAVIQGSVVEGYPRLLSTEMPLAVDLYDPMLLEGLDLSAGVDQAAAATQHRRYMRLTVTQLRRGDYFFCATERQRDYWLGALTALGRITPVLARSIDRELRGLIDLLPSGISAVPPVRQKPALRGVHPAVGPDAIILLWAGGLWDWFDPGVVIRAVAALSQEIPQLRLCFFAGARPAAFGAPIRTRTAAEARALAQELGVFDRSVIFLDRWIPYDERGNYLAEADIGVSSHQPGVETRFAFRTRLLDYIWARLPVISTAGDTLGETIAAAGAGLLVPPGNLEGWVAALRRLAGDPQFRMRARATAEMLAHGMTWEQVVRPLAEFCAQPRRTGYADAQFFDRAEELVLLLAQRDAAIADLDARAAWLEEQLHENRRALSAVENGRVMRLLRWMGRV